MSARVEQQPIVLVALDGSFAAAMALPIATAVAKQMGADCQVLHIIADNGPGTSLSRSFARSLKTLTGIRLWPDVIEPTVQLWQVFAAPANAIMGAFWHIKVRLDAGDPVAGILRASADPTVTLVVLTTHGHIVEPGRSLGRVAEQVIAQATRPILLVRPEATTWLGNDRPLHRLVLPLDGTPTTATLLAPACELASRLKAAIDLLYVAGPEPLPDEPGSIVAPRYVDQPQHEWPQWASEVSARLGAACAKCPPDIPIRTFLAHGDIGEAIARFATDQQSDAVVLARRSHLEAGRAAVLRTVLDTTPCPVLLVGEPSAEPRRTTQARRREGRTTQRAR